MHLHLLKTKNLPAKIFACPLKFVNKIRRMQKFRWARLKTNFGMSLMETVVYAALIALISILVVQTILALSKTFKAVKETRDIENSGLTALDRIAKEIRSADALGAGNIFNATSSKISLAYSGISTTTREFYLDGSGAMHLYENSVDQGTITSPNVLVTSFYVEQSTTSTKTALRVTLKLQDKRETNSPRSATFYTAAAMRNLY